MSVTSIRLSNEVEAPLENLSAKLDRSKNYLINQAVKEFLSNAMIGSAETIQQKMKVLLQHTQADELIFTCDLYEHKNRLRSFDILAGLSNILDG